ncbi:heterokaryon incompatibility protein [Colletotrichum filicis]|nr:heterokaryon incompatibility protein [Colletotrichum filicis]
MRSIQKKVKAQARVFKKLHFLRFTARSQNYLEESLIFDSLIQRNGCVSWILWQIVVFMPNLHDRLDDLPFDSLPQTYRDAVTVTAFLDIPFLWIDGLCIIQGDTDSKDWAEQSSQMAEIFGNAILVIAAAESNSVEEGFLSTPQLPRELVKF